MGLQAVEAAASGPWPRPHQQRSFTISQSLLKVMSIESVMPFNHLILSPPSPPPAFNPFPSLSLLFWKFLPVILASCPTQAAPALPIPPSLLFGSVPCVSATPLASSSFPLLLRDRAKEKAPCPCYRDFPGSAVVKNPASNAGDAGFIPGWEMSDWAS